MFRWGIPIVVIGILVTAFTIGNARSISFFNTTRGIMLESFQALRGSPRDYIAAEIPLYGELETHEISEVVFPWGKGQLMGGVMVPVSSGSSLTPTGGSISGGIAVSVSSSGEPQADFAQSSRTLSGETTAGDAGEPKTTSAQSYGELQEKCDFLSGGTPSYKVIVSEIAWMGTELSANDEWIEISGSGTQKIGIAGWRLMNESGKINSAIEIGNVSQEKFFLLERTDDATVPTVSADLIYKGSLSNTGEWLRLFDYECRLVDEVDARKGWLAGDNAAKRTMERRKDLTWQTSVDVGGTPRSMNSSGFFLDASKGNEEVALQEAIPSSSPSTASLSIIVSEAFYDAEGSDAGKEFIKLRSREVGNADLSGWKLLYNGETLVSIGGKSEDVVTISGERYFLIGFSGYNGSPSAEVLRSGSLANGAATLTLLNAGGTTIDEVSYDGTALPGQSVIRIDNSSVLRPNVSP